MFFCKSSSLLLAALAAVLLSACHSAPPAPTAAFVYAGGPYPGSPVTFANNSRGAASYHWDFGDHTTRTWADTQFTHTYARPGVYRVRLQVRSALGTDTTSQLIVVGTGHQPVAPAGPEAITPLYAANLTGRRSR